jgi:hypothetical protein
MNEGRTAGSHRTGLSSTLDLICNISVKAATDHLMHAKMLKDDPARMGEDEHGARCAKSCGLKNTQILIWFWSIVFMHVKS